MYTEVTMKVSNLYLIGTLQVNDRSQLSEFVKSHVGRVACFQANFGHKIEMLCLVRLCEAIFSRLYRLVKVMLWLGQKMLNFKFGQCYQKGSMGCILISEI